MIPDSRRFLRIQRRFTLLTAWGAFAGMALFPLFLYATRGDPASVLWLPWLAAVFVWMGVLVVSTVQASRLRYGFWRDPTTPTPLEIMGPVLAGLALSVIGGLAVFATFGESANLLTFVAATAALSLSASFAVLVWFDRQQRRTWSSVRVRVQRAPARETIAALREAFAAKQVANRFDEKARFVSELRASVFSFPPSRAKLAIRRAPFGGCVIYKFVPEGPDLGRIEEVLEETLGRMDTSAAQSL